MLKSSLFIPLICLLIATGRIGDVYAQRINRFLQNQWPLGARDVLIYTPDESGNRIPDFSYCGYKAGEQAIPNVVINVVVPFSKGRCHTPNPGRY